MAHINHRLSNARKRLALSQEELAERVGTTASNVSRWEHGVTSPTPYFRRRLSESLALPLIELFPEESPHPDNPFCFNMSLKDSQEYFGRQHERATLLSRAGKGEATSIVGPRRIGKSWLMKYLLLTAPSQLGSRARVGYLDLTAPRCATLSGFVAEAINVLAAGQQEFVELSSSPLVALENSVRALQERNQQPILCLDEFENFSGLDTHARLFLDHLRAIAQIGLGLVVASRQPLIELVQASDRTSPFFNICRQVTLKPFSRQEAGDFASQKSEQAAFNERECEFLLQVAREPDREAWFPLKLQLVGTLLYEDKLLGTISLNNAAYIQAFEERVAEEYQGTGAL
jgi:transcriptional regulator with XRE-family HTH domain